MPLFKFKPPLSLSMCFEFSFTRITTIFWKHEDAVTISITKHGLCRHTIDNCDALRHGSQLVPYQELQKGL